ncbi:AcrR family transcriptional regulator [Kitasatospora sp. MAP12-15]|uniref:TetR/AcrR family transcriptional regulator n=1 Tax=unclassified Kitasatospora TaxID=2633591 RepID=UPI002473BBE9|nr:helix-turn-helix domain-containing protein [Kitasatospora sp. MAP12-44]MDH6114809.1 AcrR family transcriptional regulator [Kitasatospora sp. MAP12-44]
MSTERPLRADARRNRERILQAARHAFAAEGIGVPLDEIARRAEVGPGTVHRHFPTKEALFEAVVIEHLEQLTRDARAALQADEVDEAGDAGSAFFAFLIRMTSEAHAKQDLADAIADAGTNLGSATVQAAADLREIFAALLERAQRANVVRTDVDAADVQAIVLAALTAQRQRADTARPDRLAALVFDCLRPNAPAAHPQS